MESTQLKVEVSKIFEPVSCEPKSGPDSGLETITKCENINERPIAIEVCRGSKEIKISF